MSPIYVANGRGSRRRVYWGNLYMELHSQRGAIREDIKKELQTEKKLKVYYCCIEISSSVPCLDYL